MPMLISTAYAQGTGLLDQSALIQFLPLVLIFIVFYFLLIRPQQKKAKDQRTMLDALRRGDRIVTGGGILGTVSKVVGPEEVEVDIATGVRVRVLRGTITSVLAKPDPAAARDAARDKDRDAAKEKETVRREAGKVCALGVLLSLPNLFTPAQLAHVPRFIPHKQVALGLDLRGGSYLLLEVDVAAAQRDHLNAIVDTVRNALRDSKVGYTGLDVE